MKVCYEEEELDIWEQPEEELPIDYVCYPTVATDAEFNLPAGITFMDLDALMNNQGFDY